MKNIISITIFIFSSLIVFGQNNSVTVVEGACQEYTFTLDGIDLAKTTNCGHDLAEELEVGSTYQLSTAKPFKGILNGVSTLDLVRIQRHLMGVELLDSPDKIIAADFDGDGAISTYDLWSLRAYILGFLAQSDVNQYLIVKADHQFPNIDGFDIDVNYDELEISSDDLDNGSVNVRVIKRGDVDNSAQ